jgi:hypothetical protein
MPDFAEPYKPTIKEIQMKPHTIDSYILQTDQSNMFSGMFYKKYLGKRYIPSPTPTVTDVPKLYFFSNDRLGGDVEKQLKDSKSDGDLLIIGAGGVGYRMWQQSSEQISKGLIIVDNDAMITDIYVPLQINAVRSSDSIAEYWEGITGYPLGYIEKTLRHKMSFSEISSYLALCNIGDSFINCGYLDRKKLEIAVKSAPSIYGELKKLMTPDYIKKLLNSKAHFNAQYHELMDRLVQKNPGFKPVPIEAFIEAFNHNFLISTTYLRDMINFPFTDQIMFAQLKAAMTLQPITTICADIFNKDHIKQIGDLLKQKERKIGAVFLSNVEDYTPSGIDSSTYFLSALNNIPRNKEVLVYRSDIDKCGSSIIGHQLNKKSWKAAGIRPMHKNYVNLHNQI